jgi:hypothetical protein
MYVGNGFHVKKTSAVMINTLHQCQQNEQSPLTSTNKQTHDISTYDVVLAWDRHKIWRG